MIIGEYKVSMDYASNISTGYRNEQKFILSGVYKLTFEGGEFYVGRSNNIYARFQDHCMEAWTNISHNHNGYYPKVSPKTIRFAEALKNEEWVTLELLSNNADDEKNIIIKLTDVKMLNTTYNSLRSNGRKVVDTDTGNIYRTITSAAKAVGYSPSHLRAMLIGEVDNKTKLKLL